MKTILYYMLALAAAVSALAGCTWEPEEPPQPVPAERVLLMYDNIGTWFDDDVIEAKAAVAAGVLGREERVVVYERMSSGNRIYELVHDNSASQGCREEILKKYAAGENSSLDRETIARIVGDARAFFPEADSWGFAFGSHGKGWLPASSTVIITRRGGLPEGSSERSFAEFWTQPENDRTRFFMGYDQKLDVSEFVDALDDFEWDFVILDDCFMSGVESLYEMRALADYIIASPTEIMDKGFPYDRVIKTIFNDWSEAGLKKMAQEFVDWYRGQNGDSASATVAVVKTSELGALAEAIGKFGLNLADRLTSVEGIQYYEGFARPSHVFYDLDDYLSRIRKETMPTEYNAFLAQLEKTVVFKDHTDKFFSQFKNGGTYVGGQTIPVTHYSGLNVFIPYAGTTLLIDAYRQTEWYRAVYAD